MPQPNLSLSRINYISPALAVPIDQDQYITRIDQKITSHDNLSGSYVMNIQTDNTVPTFVFDSRSNRARAQNLSLTEVHVFSPSVVNEFRAGWDRFYEHEFFGSTAIPNTTLPISSALAAYPRTRSITARQPSRKDMRCPRLRPPARATV